MVDLNAPASQGYTGWRGAPGCPVRHRYGASHWRPLYGVEGSDLTHEHWWEDGTDQCAPSGYLPVQKWLPSVTAPAVGINMQSGALMVHSKDGLMEVNPQTILQGMGIDPTPTNLEHYETLMIAMRNYDERNAVHQDLWQRDGVEGTIPHLLHKFKRVKRFTNEMLKRELEKGDPWVTIDELDDSVDLINYAAFMIRNGLAGRLWAEEMNDPEDED